MKQKLFNVLKPLVASKGLSKEEIEGLAEQFSKNLTETSTDAEINNVANSIIPVADLMQKMGNRMVTSVENKYKGWVDPATIQQPEPPTPPTPPQQTLTAEEISKLVNEKAQELVNAAIEPYRQREEAGRLKSLLFSHDKVKNIPDAFRSRYNLEKEDDLENVATQIENDFTSMKQELVKSGVFTEAPTASSEQAEEDDLIASLKNMNASK